LTSRPDARGVLLPRSALSLLAAAALFGVPATATAASRAKTIDPVSAAAAAGVSVWGAVPCKGRIGYRTQRALPAGLSADADAWVTFNSSLGANNLAAPASTYTDCTISFGRSRWPDMASTREDWDMFCMTMTHELGHLLGRPHDLTPGSVMAPVFADYSSEPAACRAARPLRQR
jgi:hypothetical protein